MERHPKVILTSDETMMSRYRGGMFLGFSTCAPQGILPDWLYFASFAPPVARENGRAVYSDYGLRLLEAALIESGFGLDEVAVIHPRDLKTAISAETEVVGIGVHDPLGINPPTSTFVDLIRTGPPYNRVKFLELLKFLRGEDVNIVVGGKGAWEVADPDVMDRLGIDFVHLGEGEISVPRMFKSIIMGDDVPRIVSGVDVPVESIPSIRRPSIHGLVEISRGCCRGCSFCTPNTWRIKHKSIEQVLADVRTNIRGNNHTALLHSEDLLLYGAKGTQPDREKVMGLINRVSELRGISALAASHVALSTVYHNPDLLKEISEVFASMPGQLFSGAQTGIETGSQSSLGSTCSASRCLRLQRSGLRSLPKAWDCSQTTAGYWPAQSYQACRERMRKM